jgi:hypothetical protein
VLHMGIVFHGTETWTLRKVKYTDLENFEIWCWRRTGTVIWADRVKIEVLHRAKIERNALRTVKRRKASWIGHNFLRNWLLNMTRKER